MKKTIKLLCTWAASLLLAGCSSEADMEKLMDWQSNPDAVHFTASVNNATTRTNPAATDDAQTKFNENDQVTVSNNGNQADYAYKENSWAPAIADKYLLWDRSNLTFNCWYPADGNNTATIGYLTADQSTADLMAKSDYMNAEKTLKTADEALNFSLKRKTARIILKISAFTDVPGTIKHVRIVSKASTAADETQTIDITPFAQNGEGEIGNIGTTYTALVIPGEVVAKFYFTDAMSDAKPLTMTTNVTEAGNSYIYNLNVIKRTKIEVTGITAGPWTANGTTTGDLVAGIPYVTFNADANQELMIEQVKNISNLQYSVNFGKWTDAKSDEYMCVEFGGDKGCLRLRCKGNLQGTASDYKNYAQISFNYSAEVACTGDIRTLLDYENYETVQTSGALFCSLFKNCTQLTSAPDLPATELYDYCYNGMFKGCTSLEKAPDLPATTLKQSCYSGMFQGCTSLKEAPTLQAKKMAPSAYRGMFNGCTRLVTAPALPATQIAEECYSYMFLNCTSLTNVPTELPAKTMADHCYASMFQGCTSLKTAPVLPATTLDGYCYSSMFDGCKNLETAPDLPAEAATACCYYFMFSGCSKLETAPKLSAKSLERQSCSNMFQNCTSLKTAPVLPAKSLDSFCYGYMFSGCTSLQKAPDLPATKLAESCYNSMFSGCTSLTTAPKLPAKELFPRCYLGMFSGCTSLTTAPDLLVTKLEPGCYEEMFYGCKKLKSVKMLAPSHKNMSNYFQNWLTGAGTKANTGRTLILKDQAAYDALKTNNLLPANYWQAGKCTVKAADGTMIK